MGAIARWTTGIPRVVREFLHVVSKNGRAVCRELPVVRGRPRVVFRELHVVSGNPPVVLQNLPVVCGRPRVLF